MARMVFERIEGKLYGGATGKEPWTGESRGGSEEM
jgi:hypothetical protein